MKTLSLISIWFLIGHAQEKSLLEKAEDFFKASAPRHLSNFEKDSVLSGAGSCTTTMQPTLSHPSRLTIETSLDPVEDKLVANITLDPWLNGGKKMFRLEEDKKTNELGWKTQGDDGHGNPLPRYCTLRYHEKSEYFVTHCDIAFCSQYAPTYEIPRIGAPPPPKPPAICTKWGWVGGYCWYPNKKALKP